MKPQWSTHAPIGAILLFLPCVFGLALGAAPQQRGFGAAADFRLLALFGAGAIVMRGAGCTYNDILDRDIDAAVLRTRNRPIPAGRIEPAPALGFGVTLAVGSVLVMGLDVSTETAGTCWT